MRDLSIYLYLSYLSIYLSILEDLDHQVGVGDVSEVPKLSVFFLVRWRLGPIARSFCRLSPLEAAKDERTTRTNCCKLLCLPGLRPTPLSLEHSEAAL